MTKLELVNLVKRFGEVVAVNGVNLSVAPGSLVALLGPSGCGKTTTLRMIAGLEPPSSGDILFDGESVRGTPPERRNIGMVFQRYVLFPHMNVEKNVSFGLRMRGVDRGEVDRRVAEVLGVVQLTGFGKRFPSQLSGGQQQRVAIARTVVTDPRLLLMDEPLSNLDAKLREEMRSFIIDLQKRLGITTVFVTHDQVEAIELADRVGVIFGGELVQFGTPEEIFNRPVSARVADFMGATNLIRGEVRAKSDGETTLHTDVGAFTVAHAPPQPVGAEVTATVRPEHIDIALSEEATQSEESGLNRLRGRVTDAVYYGGVISYQIRANELQLNVKDRSTRRFSPGEEVTLAIAKENLWIFPDDQPLHTPAPKRKEHV